MITADGSSAQGVMDAINDAVNKFVANSKKATSSMKDAKSAGDAMSESVAKASISVGNLSQKTQQADNNTKRATQSVKQMGSEMRNSRRYAQELSDEFMHLAKGGQALERVGGVISVGITLPLIAAGKAALDASMDMEQITRGLNAVTGSAAETNKQMERLKKLGELPGLTFEQAAKASARLQAVGYSAEFAEKTIKEMGNAITLSGGGAEELDGVVRALGQIEGKGELRAQELNQLAEHIPTIRKALKEAFGTGNTEQIQNMGLSTQETIQKIVAAMQKFPRVARGMRDEVDDFRTSIKLSMAEIGDAIYPIEAAFMKNLAPAVKGVADWFKSLPPIGKDVVIGFVTVTAATGPLLYGLGLLSRTVRDLREGWEALRVLAPRIAAFFSANAANAQRAAIAEAEAAAATKADTVAKNEQTAAVNLNNRAVIENNTLEDIAAFKAARAAEAITLETEAISANTAARNTNAVSFKTWLAEQEALNASMAIPTTFPGKGVGGAVANAGKMSVGAGIGTALATIGEWVPVVVAAVATAAVLYTAVEHFVTKPFIEPAVRRWTEAKMPEINARRMRKASANEEANNNTDFLQRRGVQAKIEELKSQGLSQKQAEENVLRARANADQITANEIASMQVQQEQKQQEENLKQLKKRYAMEDAKYESELQSLRVEAAAGDKKELKIRQEKVLLEIMNKRATDLYARAEEIKGRMGNDLDLQKEYYDALKDADSVKEQIVRIQVDAAKERENEQKELIRKQKQAVKQQRELFASTQDIMLLQLRATAKGSANEEDDADVRSMQEARAIIPGLQAMQQSVIAEAQELIKAGINTIDDQKEYLSLAKEYWELRLREQDAVKTADKSQQTLMKRAKQRERETTQAWLEAVQEEAMSVEDNAKENERAQAALQVQLPAIRMIQQQLLDDLNSNTLSDEEYFKTKKQFWEEERKANSLIRNAMNEANENGSKAYEEMKKNSQEQSRVIDAQLKLDEAKIKNNPFLNYQQRISLLLRNALQKIQQQARPVAGETELEAINRQTKLENMMGDTLKNYAEAYGGGALRLRGNHPFNYLMMQRRALQQFYQQIQNAASSGENMGPIYAPFDPMKAGEKFAGEAAMGRPVIMQVLFDPNMSNEEARQAVWMQIYQTLNQQVYGPQPTLSE